MLAGSNWLAQCWVVMGEGGHRQKVHYFHLPPLSLTHTHTHALPLSHFRPSGWKVKKTNLKRQLHSEKQQRHANQRGNGRQRQQKRDRKSQSIGRDVRERDREAERIGGSLTSYLKKL